MRRHPGFLNTLQEQIENLDVGILTRISKHGGLDISDLISFLLEPKDHTVDFPEVVESHELFQHAQLQDYTDLGKQLVEKNCIAVCLLAGGAGTRAGGPKCLMKIFNNETLLSLKLKQLKDIKHIWILVTEDLAEEVRQHLNEKELLRDGIELITQYESLRLLPDNQLLLIDDKPSLYPCGHGDVIPALINSNTLNKFCNSGGKHMVVMNVDNILANVDFSILGLHHANNTPITCEIVKKIPADKGGVLCRHMGINQIVEEYRLSPETDLTKFEYINTNTMIINTDLNFDTITWRWHRVKKIINHSAVIQYERLLQQLTEHFKTQFVEVNRAQRFSPIKSASDLDKLKIA